MSRNHRAAKALSLGLVLPMNLIRTAIEAAAAKFGATARFHTGAGGCLLMVALTITTADSVRSRGVPLHIGSDQASHDSNLRRVALALDEMTRPRVFISPG